MKQTADSVTAPQEGTAIIAAEQLSRVYGSGDSAVKALDRIDLAITPGEFVAVMGPSGCGKSTLLHLLGGLDRPNEGRVLFEGHDLAVMDDAALTKVRRRRMGFVFQFFNLIPVLDATENAALPLLLDGVPRNEARAKANELLVQVGLGDRLRNRPDQMSGGQQQRVAIARALVAQPALVLADEPTGNLDSKSAEEIAELLKGISETMGRSVVMVTHDARTASHAKRVILMKDGRIVDQVRLDGADSIEVAADLVKRIDTL
jgi:putative ABC transport system ATP-binding protein